MKLEKTFQNCKIASLKNDMVVLVDGPDELFEIFDGPFVEDNCQKEGEETFPKDPGFYVCDIEFWFQQGYFEGYIAHGESEFDFKAINVRKFNTE
jgi:hypothetical protein